MSLVECKASAELYGIFTFEPMNNLVLRSFKVFNHCMIQNISSNELSANPSVPGSKPRQFSFTITAVLWRCNTLLSEFQKKIRHPWYESGFLEAWRFIQIERNIPSNLLKMYAGRYRLQSFGPFLPVHFCICRHLDVFPGWRTFNEYSCLVQGYQK